MDHADGDIKSPIKCTPSRLKGLAEPTPFELRPEAAPGSRSPELQDRPRSPVRVLGSSEG